MTTVHAAPRFFASEALVANASLVLGEDAARHMRVLRLGPGSPVLLLDGQGTRAWGTLRTLAKRDATVDIERAEECAPLAAIHALVPIADRDRMLWLAEKCAEIGVASWRPVMWRRSRSVSPKGEGSTFQGKVRARMVAALEQSGNAWLPMIFPDASPEHAIAALPEGVRVALDASGGRVATALNARTVPPLTIAVGPEGGLDDAELDMLKGASFVVASLGPTILRFETAGIAALAYARATLEATAHGTLENEQ